MPSPQPVSGTPGIAPASGVQNQPSSSRPALAVERDWLWKPDIGDVTLALRALAVSYGVILGVILFLVPGAGVLAAAAFWHPGLVFTWQVSLAIAFGTSLVLLLALTLLSGFIGGRASPVFMLLALAALITLWVVRHRDPILVDALWNHLTR